MNANYSFEISIILYQRGHNLPPVGKIENLKRISLQLPILCHIVIHCIEPSIYNSFHLPYTFTLNCAIAINLAYKYAGSFRSFPCS